MGILYVGNMDEIIDFVQEHVTSDHEHRHPDVVYGMIEDMADVLEDDLMFRNEDDGLMPWHYVAVKVQNEIDGATEYTVGECFPGLVLDSATAKHPYSLDATFRAESVHDLIRWLRTAADDIEKYGCINEED